MYKQECQSRKFDLIHCVANACDYIITSPTSARNRSVKRSSSCSLSLSLFLMLYSLGCGLHAANPAAMGGAGCGLTAERVLQFAGVKCTAFCTCTTCLCMDNCCARLLCNWFVGRESEEHLHKSSVSCLRRFACVCLDLDWVTRVWLHVEWVIERVYHPPLAARGQLNIADIWTPSDSG